MFLCAVLFEDIYLENDAILNATVNVSDLVSFLVILYLYSPTKKKKKPPPNWCDGTAVGSTTYKLKSFKLPDGSSSDSLALTKSTRNQRARNKNSGEDGSVSIGSRVPSRNLRERKDASDTEEIITIEISRK